MDEEATCGHCGHQVSDHARYCANCGRALVPFGDRLEARVERLRDSLTPVHADLFGLLVLAAVSVAVENLVLYKLSFLATMIGVGLVIGFAGAYVGWQWSATIAGRTRLVQVVQVTVGTVILLGVIWIADWFLLALLGEGGFSIPGVSMEVSAGSPRSMLVSDPPPYWLLFAIYGVVAAAAGYGARRWRGPR